MSDKELDLTDLTQEDELDLEGLEDIPSLTEIDAVDEFANLNLETKTDGTTKEEQDHMFYFEGMGEEGVEQKKDDEQTGTTQTDKLLENMNREEFNIEDYDFGTKYLDSNIAEDDKSINDKYEYLLGNKLFTELPIEMQLKRREVKELRSNLIPLTEDQPPSEEEKYNFNFDSSLPNIPQEEISEYILVQGLYTDAFKEFIKSKSILIEGHMPLAIEVQGEHVTVRYINPEPKVLYYLKRVLVGFDIKHIKEDKEEELNIYTFLGKVPIKL